MFDQKVIRTLALISQVGISMMVPIFLMAWLGSWIDHKFSTQLFPLFLLLGIGGGFRSVYTIVRYANEDRHKEKEDENTGKRGS